MLPSLLTVILRPRPFDFQIFFARPRSGRFSFRNPVRWFLFKITGVVDDTLNGDILDFR
jgi:hypothetical protein